MPAEVPKLDPGSLVCGEGQGRGFIAHVERAESKHVAKHIHCQSTNRLKGD
jgi:hypothetical protein